MGQSVPPPLVAAAMKKVALVWLAPLGGPAVAAWLLWQDGSAYVVGGPGEQPLTGIAPGRPALVTVASPDTHNRLLTWVADVQQVDPGSQEWGRIVPQLLAKRLSAAADATARWAGSGRVLRLSPTGELTEVDETLPTTDLAAPPVPTPATTAYRMPRRRHRSPRQSPQ